MKEQEKTILKAIGDIEDRFVDEASFIKENNKENSGFKIVNTKRNKSPWMQAIAIAACLVLVIGIAGSGFSSGDKQLAPSSQGIVSSDTASEKESWNLLSNKKESKYEDEAPSYINDGEYKDISSEKTEKSGQDTNITQGSYDAIGDAMLVYKSNISAQTTEYETAVKGIKEKVAAAGGYIEAQTETAGNYYSSSSLRYATFSIRVPSKAYREFVEGVSNDDSKLVVYKASETVDDIGLTYYETEERLKTLYIKEERLQSLLKEAKGLSDIITLENELSNTEQEIDSYTQDLRKYTSLVNYSTIYLTVEEVYKADQGIEVRDNFFTRLGRAFKNGFSDFADGVENFILWFARNILAVAFLAIVIVLLLKFRPITKLWRKIRKK